MIKLKKNIVLAGAGATAALATAGFVGFKKNKLKKTADNKQTK